MSEKAANSSCLTRYIDPASAWALSFGCIVGWGAFVMPGTTFLPTAGPVGTAIGMLVGALVMIVIGINYRFLMRFCPDAGGTFTYAKKTFGDDHGFLSAWFMILAYVSILWANVTALALIARSLFGGVLQFGYLYNIAGYDVYIGEVLVELAVMFVFGAVCLLSKRLAAILQTLFAAALFIGIVASFIVVLCGGSNSGSFLTPAFVPEVNVGTQILGIVALAPWAFVGFESVSNSAEEFRFPIKRILAIMLSAIICGGLSYILLSWIASTSLPAGYGDWSAYIADIGELSGTESLPVFFAIETAGGAAGMLVLGIALVSAILTGIIGSTVASSRLLYAMSKDGILPKQFSKLTPRGIPRNAVLFLLAVSVVIPFLGRTAIGWVVDVITVGTTIAYGYTSAAAFKRAKHIGNKRIMGCGIAGVVISAIIGMVLLIPDLLAQSALAAESYLLLAFWGILGIVMFRVIFGKDENRRFGSSNVVWIALLFLIFFTSLMWVRQATQAEARDVVESVSSYYTEEMAQHGITLDEADTVEEREHLEAQMSRIDSTLTNNSLVQMVLIMLSLVIVFNIYTVLHKREKHLESQKVKAEESSKAKSAFLSNMSHDIRTPMNAIVGYVNLAKDEELSLPEIREYLGKIENSSQHLLALINDILEMSRIESGKMEPELVSTDLRRIMADVRDMFAAQMSEKKITYTVKWDGIDNYGVMCDKNRLNRVLLNLISNAYKFTPIGGSVSVSLTQQGPEENGSCKYELRVKDSGIGMSPEFAERVFEAFERERTSTVSGIQGTGLGMAITKSIVDMMGGSIHVVTAPNQGSEFIIELSFATSAIEDTEQINRESARSAEKTVDFTGMRLLLTDDVMINREIAAKILRKLGFTVETAENGQEAVDKVSGSEAGYYAAVLMDIQMPVMDGYEATRQIRCLPDKSHAEIPVIAMTANAFSEDVQKAKDAGMNAHVAKPIDMQNLVQTLTDVLGQQ